MMVTSSILPGASEMSGEAKKQNRPSLATSNNPVIATRAKQNLHLAPKLATSGLQEKGLESSHITSPRLLRDTENSSDKTSSPNVTPRSSARRSRIGDLSQLTPDHTPVTTPSSSRPASLLAPRLSQQPQITRTGRLSAQPKAGRPSRGKSYHETKTPQDPASQFFLASDAPVKRNRSPILLAKSAAFVYANGEEGPLELKKRDDRRLSRSPGPRPVGKVSSEPVGKRRISSRSTPAESRATLEARNIPAAMSPPSLSIPISDLRILSRTIRGAATRSKSPLKKFEVDRGPDTIQRRRSSIDSSPAVSRQPSGVYKHVKKQSSGSVSEQLSIPEMIQSAPSLPAQTRQFPSMSPTSPHSFPFPAPLFSTPGSPTAKRESGPGDEASLAVADARKDRKILDLEISNSSLLAFNRSLERDNRKLKADLRRYRRITNASAMSEISVFSPPLTADEGDSENSQEIESEANTSDSSAVLSDGQQAAQEIKDRRRLRRDLSRHKQLIDDSQHMNQSIKHCLDVTDALIADARKALEQRPELTEDDLRGRVLQSDDIEEDLAQSRGLLSPAKKASIVWSANGPTEADGKSL